MPINGRPFRPLLNIIDNVVSMLLQRSRPVCADRLSHCRCKQIGSYRFKSTKRLSTVRGRRYLGRRPSPSQAQICSIYCLCKSIQLIHREQIACESLWTSRLDMSIMQHQTVMYITHWVSRYLEKWLVQSHKFA